MRGRVRRLSALRTRRQDRSGAVRLRWLRNSACSHAAISGSSGAITCGIASTTVTPKSRMLELFGHFEADVAAADHDGAAGFAILDPCHDLFHVGNVAHGKMARTVNAGNRRFERRRAGGKNQRIVRLLVFAAGRKIAHIDDCAARSMRHDFGVDAHVEIEPGAEAFRAFAAATNPVPRFRRRQNREARSWQRKHAARAQR